jgi:hypothetical protein
VPQWCPQSVRAIRSSDAAKLPVMDVGNGPHEETEIDPPFHRCGFTELAGPRPKAADYRHDSEAMVRMTPEDRRFREYEEEIRKSIQKSN